MQTNVLLIDDEPEVLAGLTKVLSAVGYVCHTANSPYMAQSIARSITPDLVISDINLAGDSGLELCEKLRSMAGMNDVPVMFLSGAQIPDIIRRAHAAGGTYYLRKPFDPGVLVDLVDKALWMPHVATKKSANAEEASQPMAAAKNMAAPMAAILPAMNAKPLTAARHFV